MAIEGPHWICGRCGEGVTVGARRCGHCGSDAGLVRGSERMAGVATEAERGAYKPVALARFKGDREGMLVGVLPQTQDERQDGARTARLKERVHAAERGRANG